MNAEGKAFVQKRINGPQKGCTEQSTSYGAMRIRYKGSRPSLISVPEGLPWEKRTRNAFINARRE
jgi:hypothetical protein